MSSELSSRGQQILFDRVRAVKEHGGGGHAKADDVGEERCLCRLHFLVGDPLTVLAATATDLRRVVATDQARVIGRLLPALQPLERRRIAELQRTLRQFYRWFARVVALQPVATVGAELRLFGRILLPSLSRLYFFAHR